MRAALSLSPQLRHSTAARAFVSTAVALGACCCALACVLATAAAAPSPTYAQPGSAASHTSPIETHHSLNRPFDSHSVYWRYGGATVFTQKAIRLTPATQV